MNNGKTKIRRLCRYRHQSGISKKQIWQGSMWRIFYQTCVEINDIMVVCAGSKRNVLEPKIPCDLNQTTLLTH